MRYWIHSLDRILRGEATSIAALSVRELDVPVWGLCVLIDTLGLLYGLCMGVFDLTAGGSNAWKQTIACMLKVPALFLLTLLVTTPSLYVFNAIVGSRLYFRSMIRLLVAALAVMLAILASIGPIVAFFSFTTTSYSFMVLLNVTVFAVAGLLGMKFLLQSLHRLTVFQIFSLQTLSTLEPSFDESGVQQTAPSSQPLPIGSLDPLGDRNPIRSVRSIFQIWVIVFGLVGTQMAWVLRPFLGHPNAIRYVSSPGSNFFLAVWEHANNLLR